MSEAIKDSSEQEDPTVMYLIVRESLGMSVGKTAAQCAHASQMLQLNFNKVEKTLCELESLKESFGSWLPVEAAEWFKLQSQYVIFIEWLNSSFRKVVLKADDKEWAKIKTENLNHVLVVDAGLTEIPSGSETVIGLWPMYKSQVPKVIKRLQVLK